MTSSGRPTRSGSPGGPVGLLISAILAALATGPVPSRAAAEASPAVVTPAGGETPLRLSATLEGPILTGPDRMLLQGVTYTLHVDLAAPGGEPPPGASAPFPPPRVDVVVECQLCDKSQQRQRVALDVPLSGGSQARILLRPVKPGRTKLFISMEQDARLLQTSAVSVEVVRAFSLDQPLATQQGATRGSLLFNALGSTRTLAGVKPGYLQAFEASPAAAISASAPLSILGPATLSLSPGESPELQPDLVLDIRPDVHTITASGPVVARLAGEARLEVQGPSSLDVTTLMEDVLSRLLTLTAPTSPRLVFSPADEQSGRYVALNEESRKYALLQLARAGHEMYRRLFARSAKLVKLLNGLDSVPGEPRIHVRTKGIFLPWALMYPSPAVRQKDAVAREQGFWGSRYRLVGVPLRQEQRPTARHVGRVPGRLLVAYYAGEESPFPYWRTQQREYFQGRAQEFSLKEVLKEKDFLDGLQADAENWHMVYAFAHGQSGAKQIKVRLADPEQTTELWVWRRDNLQLRLAPGGGLTPDAILELNVAGTPLNQPFVFLNICQGAVTTVQTQDNLVSAFLNVGAGAVLAADSDMLQGLAAHFARDLFERIKSGQDRSLSGALLTLRRDYIRENPLALLYTLWGDGVIAPR